METMDKSYEGLPDGAQVFKEVNSADELEQGKTYFNPRNGKLAMFLGPAMSPDDLKVRQLWLEKDSVSGESIEGKTDEDAFSFPLLCVELPDGFFKLGKTWTEA